jgi:hypothetical protein
MTPPSGPPGCLSRSSYCQRSACGGRLASTDYFDSGAFLADPIHQVAFHTESQRAGPYPDLRAYREQETVPAADRLGATGPGAGQSRRVLAVF